MVYKLLEMLPKRGPDAFDNFVDIIQNDYPWLAATLQSSLKSEIAKSGRIDSYKSDNTGKLIYCYPNSSLDFHELLCMKSLKILFQPSKGKRDNPIKL